MREPPVQPADEERIVPVVEASCGDLFYAAPPPGTWFDFGGRCFASSAHPPSPKLAVEPPECAFGYHPTIFWGHSVRCCCSKGPVSLQDRHVLVLVFGTVEGAASALGISPATTPREVAPAIY
mmetsp:Transcript_73008/g.144715  ORF Transcript_73008/g.144715 Transcript_73008/m.144715 type:complete len:123 (-) Transcript_73008:490-858(-)